MFRVRQITDHLTNQTPQLIKDGLLPANIDLLLSSNKVVRYPPIIYNLQKQHKWAFSQFGIYMENLIRLMLIGDWKDKVYKLFLASADCFTEQDVSKLVSEKDLYSCMGRFVNISKYIAKIKDDLLFDAELIHDTLSGHPDIITAKYAKIYDIKTTTKFDSPTMKNGTILQITAYLALARASGYNPTKIGIILPFQQETLTYSLKHSNYDHRPFLKLLLDLIKPRIHTFDQQFELDQFFPLIGSHTKKIKGSLYQSLLNFYQVGFYRRPCQIFMRGNRGAQSVSLKDSDIASALEYIYNNGIRYYTHASYAINLCHPCGIKTKKDIPDEWATRILREDLELTSVSGGRGVVVHTGKAMHLSETDAYDAMHTSIIDVLNSATKECPLMIETPVDKGTELCGVVQSLADFYLQFNAKQRKKIKICVDTCHVFAAGYLPYNYIIELTSLIGEEAIGLIHLNDAQWPKGSSKDGHKWIGEGFIGLAEMLKVVRWAAERDVAMVHE